jgi:NADPH:quinone reductase-like Zn-dependent oxidoreductase
VAGTPAENQEAIVAVKELLEAGAIRPVIDRRYRLEEIVEAHRVVDDGHKRGSVVIDVDRADAV